MSKTKASNRRRYRPVSEFDEATLACKREYWRTRKREQRAKQSQDKTSSKSPNTEICKPAVITPSSINNHGLLDIPHFQLNSTFLQSAGSNQTGGTQSLTCHLTEMNVETEIDKKQTWCEKVKLNKPESSPVPKKCMARCKEGMKSLTSKKTNADKSIIKPNGVLLTKSLPVPTAGIKVHVNITETQRKTQNRSSAFNSNLSDISQQTTVSSFTPVYNQQKKPQIKSCLTSRSAAFVEIKVAKDQHTIGRRGANSNRKMCAYVPECSKVQDRSAHVPVTEEEMAAKRRENWRIKKREQRAKRAEKLKKDKERICSEKAQQKIKMLSCIVPAHSLSSMNAVALRDARQLNSLKSVGLIGRDGKPVCFSLSPRRKQSPCKYNSAKTDDFQGTVVKHLSSGTKSHLQNFKPNNMYVPSGISLQSSSSAQASGHSRIVAQKLIHTQKRQCLPLPEKCTNHRQNCKPNNLSLSSGVSLQSSSASHTTRHSRILAQKWVNTQKRQSLPPRNDRVETAEERHAKQREYWRIKKRLQRARLSVEAKARLKERDALKQCAVRFQTNLGQVRKAQTGFQRRPPPNKNMLTSASKNGFIEEDGTVSIPVSKALAKIPTAVTSCHLRAVKSAYSTCPQTSQKLVCVQDSSPLHGISNNINSTVNVLQRSTGQNISNADPVVESKLSCIPADANILRSLTEANKPEEIIHDHRIACRKEVMHFESSHVTPESDVVPHSPVKQEPCYPTIDSIYSLAEQSPGMDVKNEKPAPSPPSETKVEKDVSSVCDNQTTTSLVVASMQKLLEESLSTVVDTNTSPTGQDELFSCKTELPPQETETCSDLTIRHGSVQCSFSGYTNPSIEVKQSPPLYHSPPQAPGFSAEDTIPSCQASSFQLPCNVPAERLCFSQSPEDGAHDVSMAIGVNPALGGTQVHSCNTAGPQPWCPTQACGSQQLSEHSELQKKREYWRIMKRRQRANKAKEMERSKCSAVFHKQHSQRNCIRSQIHHSSVSEAGSQSNPNNHAAPSVATLRLTRHVLSPTESNHQANQHSSNWGKTSFSETPQVKKWQLQESASPSTRPDNMTSTQINHVKPYLQTQKRRPFMTNLRNKQNHFKAAASQGLDPEEILRRKRMHWRIKKQEQRAKKAARERELSLQANIGHSGLNSSNHVTALVQSTPPERLNCLPELCQATNFKDEADLCFAAADDFSEEPLSETKWRNTYLMDYDPINQLLVCMVCGEQQYCLSVEGAKSHIEEAHPGTLSLEERERQRILQAWDEQVAVRERFFTNQLWQQGEDLKEQTMMHTAEIEVILDAEDTKQTKT